MARIKDLLKEKAEEIDREIEKVLPKKIDSKWLNYAMGKADFSYDEETLTKGLTEPIWELLERGGKRWRPVLMLLSCEAVGGKSEKALPFAPLIELVHGGTLVVDDVEDDSEMRRGKPCIHKIFGIDLAVNAGNAMYFIPLTLLYKNPYKLDNKTLVQAYDLYSQELLRVSLGQAMDIYWHQGKKYDIKEEHYLQMCYYKTGCLARFATKLGGILGKATEKQINALGKFGGALGVGFQIQDDILDISGKDFAKGKGLLGGDIHEGKRTLLVLHALEKGSEEDKTRLTEILNSHPSEQETINEAIEIIKKYNSIEYAKEKAKEIVLESWKELDKNLKKSHAKEKLEEFTQYAVEREI